MPDRLDNRFRLHQGFVVPEAQNNQSSRLEKSRTRTIKFFGVLRSIQFDCELGCLTEKVDDVR